MFCHSSAKRNDSCDYENNEGEDHRKKEKHRWKGKRIKEAEEDER